MLKSTEIEKKELLSQLCFLRNPSMKRAFLYFYSRY